MTVETLESLVSALAGSIGEDQARAIVTREAARLGLSANLTPAERVRLLRHIEALSGPVGLAARLLLVRLERSLTSTASSTSSQHLEPARPPSPSQASPDRVPVVELVVLFSKSLGETVADDLVRRTMAKLKIAGESLSAKDAAAILDAIDLAGGVAGAVARFAKVRFLLRFKRGAGGRA